MLKEATLQDVQTHAALAYALACDPARSCYPTYADGIKTKEDFLLDARRAAEGETSELLLFEMDGVVEGWLSYF